MSDGPLYWRRKGTSEWHLRRYFTDRQTFCNKKHLPGEGKIEIEDEVLIPPPAGSLCLKCVELHGDFILIVTAMRRVRAETK